MSLSKVYKGNADYRLVNILAGNFDNGGAAPALPQDLDAFQYDKDLPASRQAGPDPEKIRAEAYLQGKQAGLEEAEQQFGATLKAFAGAVAEIGRLRQTILKNSSHDMLQLVIAISAQIIQQEISISAEIIVATIQKALRAAARADEFHIKINPTDFETATQNRPLLLASISGLRNITFEAAPEISRGGCLIESEQGRVDATIETQIDEVRQHLSGLMEGNRDAVSG